MEDAPPVDAVDVVAERLALMLGAVDVGFLIADFSGHAVVRFVQADAGAAQEGRRLGSEGAETVTLADTVYGRVLRTQQTDVAPQGEGARLITPVTDRGTPSGCWSWRCRGIPTMPRSPRSPLLPTRWRSW